LIVLAISITVFVTIIKKNEVLIMPNEKRKTTTSSAVKRKYNNKTYSPITAILPKDLVAEFKSLCVKNGVSQASIVKAAVEKYIAENKE
ncbi:MAG: hypothetical protein LUG95_01265, partial [Clostridiales bacterium]|nr:hypothetical protein [Clostridiales bacterium]